MKIAYFDCFSGASGNMIVGALLDAGLSLDALERELRKLPERGFSLTTQRVDKRGLGAVYFDVHVPGEDGQLRGNAHESANVRDHRHEGIAHRRLRDVLAIVHAAQFPAPVERMATSIYTRLAQAEARVHGVPVEDIAFHEVGQIDAIVDIAAASLGLHVLGIESVYCSALPCGRGRTRSAHGEMPSPAPATTELLRDKPTFTLDVDGEFVTPTGAAILTSIANFEPRPSMTLRAIGYGAGRSDFPFPNVLRVMIGESIAAAQPATPAAPHDVVQLETNIDDMNPQFYEHVVERLFAGGALDVWTQAITMKKGRPAVMLCALASPERSDAVASLMLAETTSLGVRRWNVSRLTLSRHTTTADTSFGPIRVKIIDGEAVRRVRPEFEDVRAIAEREGKPLADIMARLEREVDNLFK